MSRQTYEEHLGEYVDRGSARGAGAVYKQAAREAENGSALGYVQDEPRSRRGFWMAAAASAAIICCLAALAYARSDNGSEPAQVASGDQVGELAPGECAAPRERPEHPTEDQVRDAEAAIRESAAIEAETGWARAKGESLVEDGVWYCGWVRPTFPTFEYAAELRETGYQPLDMYFEPDGEILGYSYGTAGILPVDAPADFDIEAAIIERNGCPELLEADCD